MTPGPISIRKCSECGKYIGEETLASGNTFGARYWTDGKREAPMLPDLPWLVKCPHCNALVWIDEQTKVGEVEPWFKDGEECGEFGVVFRVVTPGVEDYATFLEMGPDNEEKERYIRIHAWWAGNDSRRGSEHPAPLNDFESSNLRAMLPLLDESVAEDCIMKSEALRELGAFEAAEALLEREFEGGLTLAVSIIRDLIQKRESPVAEISIER